MAHESLRELTINRTFNAPLARVWEAWTDPKQIAQWWGPRGVTNPTCVWDARESGEINIVMLAGAELGPLAGQEWPMTGSFKMIDPPRKIVFTGSAIVDGAAILENIVTVEFEEAEGKTDMKLHVAVTKALMPQAEGPLSGMEAGWTQSIDKLGEFLNPTIG